MWAVDQHYASMVQCCFSYSFFSRDLDRLEALLFLSPSKPSLALWLSPRLLLNAKTSFTSFSRSGTMMAEIEQSPMTIDDGHVMTYNVCVFAYVW
jgi:hypothetical protein